jgi:hypothetical protein
MKFARALTIYCCDLLSSSSSPIAQQPLLGQGILVAEAPRLHSDTSHLVGLLWTGYQPDAETFT